MVQLLPPRLALVLLFTLDRSKALAFGLSQCLILEFRRLFLTNPSEVHPVQLKGRFQELKKCVLRVFLQSEQLLHPPRTDLIETRPDPFSGAQEFHQCNNGPASFNNQSAPPPACPYGAANSSERA